MPDNNHIPDSGKANEPPKAGNTEPIKADSPVAEQPGPLKAEPPVAKTVPKTAPSPVVEKPSEGKELSGSAVEQPAPAEKDTPKEKVAPAAGKDAPPRDKEPPDKPLPEDKQTTIPGMEAPAGKVVDFAAARDGAAKGEQTDKSPDTLKPRRGRKPKDAAQDKDTPGDKPRDKVSRGKRGKAAPERDTPGGGAAAGAPAVEENAPSADVEATFGLKDATRATKEEVVYLDLSELHAFKDHPFKVREDTEMQSLVESVKTGGVNQPALVRPREGGGYEIIAGHRRQKASELAGFRNMPCIVREMTDDEAILAMTDDNLRHRDHILLTEKAKALQQQVDAISHRGVRLQNVAEGDIGKRSTEIVGARNGLNYKKVMRLIRLNYLVQELKDRLDGTAINADGKPAKKIAFTPAVELSYIRPKNQRLIAVSIEGEQASPSLSQAKKLRELDEKGLLNGDVIDGILSEEKKEVDQVIISTEELNKYFGKEVTPRQMKDQIIALLDEWKEKQPPEKKAELEK